MTRRGAMLTADYRCLRPNDSGSISVAWLPHDAITNTERYSIALKENSGFRLGIRRIRQLQPRLRLHGRNRSRVGHCLSDRLDHAVSAGSRAHLFEWTVDRIGARAALAIFFQRFHLQPRAASQCFRYRALQRGRFRFWRRGRCDALHHLVVGYDARQSASVFNPYVSYPIERPGWFITPEAGVAFSLRTI